MKRNTNLTQNMAFRSDMARNPYNGSQAEEPNLRFFHITSFYCVTDINIQPFLYWFH